MTNGIGANRKGHTDPPCCGSVVPCPLWEASLVGGELRTTGGLFYDG